jgi:hypothetical protein
MIDVSEVVNDPDLAQEFTILRSSGSYLNGVFQSSTTPIQGFGVVTVATAREIEMVPEGDRVTGMMSFHSNQPILGTRANGGATGASDILLWHGEKYRVLAIWNWSDYGYYDAIASRMKAA